MRRKGARTVRHPAQPRRPPVRIPPRVRRETEVRYHQDSCSNPSMLITNHSRYAERGGTYQTRHLTPASFILCISRPKFRKIVPRPLTGPPNLTDKHYQLNQPHNFCRDPKTLRTFLPGTTRKQQITDQRSMYDHRPTSILATISVSVSASVSISPFVAGTGTGTLMPTGRSRSIAPIEHRMISPNPSTLISIARIRSWLGSLYDHPERYIHHKNDGLIHVIRPTLKAFDASSFCSRTAGIAIADEYAWYTTSVFCPGGCRARICLYGTFLVETAGVTDVNDILVMFCRLLCFVIASNVQISV